MTARTLPPSSTISELKMTEREQRSRHQEDRRSDEQGTPTSRGEDVADKIDGLLDEIDTVLEENAEEFVKNYVQKGGE